MRSIFSLMACLACLGCTSAKPLPEGPPPSDFCLVLSMRLPPKPDSDEPYGATFIVEPDRILRAATGPGCTISTYPDPTAQLSADDLQEVYDLTRAIGFQNQTAPGDPDSNAMIHVVARANGRTMSAIYTDTTGGAELGTERPELMRLVDLLHKKAGIEIHGHSE